MMFVNRKVHNWWWNRSNYYQMVYIFEFTLP